MKNVNSAVAKTLRKTVGRHLTLSSVCDALRAGRAELGLIPSDGGSWLLPRVIGHSRAAKLFFTGDVIDAPTAAEWGLVSRVVPADRLTRPWAWPAASPRCRQPLMHLTKDHMEGLDALIERREGHFTGR